MRCTGRLLELVEPRKTTKYRQTEAHSVVGGGGAGGRQEGRDVERSVPPVGRSTSSAGGTDSAAAQRRNEAHLSRMTA